MALTSVGGNIFYPMLWQSVSNNNTLDGTTTGRAFFFYVPKTGTIDRVSIYIPTVTSSQTLRVGIETLSSGNPSGTQYGGSAVATGTPTAGAVNEFTLATPASATVGDHVAVVIQWDGTAGNLTVATLQEPPDFGNGGHNASYAGSWTTNVTKGVCSIRYDDGTYGYTEMFPAGFSESASTFNSGSTPDEKGNKFTIPFGVSICGLWFSADMDAAADFVLYDAADTVLASKSWDQARNATATARGIVRFAPVEVDANDSVRAVVLPTSASAVGFRSWTFTSGQIAAMPGGGNIVGTYRTNAGSWTDDTSQVWPIGLIIDKIEIGGGGGGLLTHPGMAGGLRG